MNFYRNKAQNMNKSLCCLALMALTTFGASAQSGTNSPYSQFGLGDLVQLLDGIVLHLATVQEGRQQDSYA